MIFHCQVEEGQISHNPIHALGLGVRRHQESVGQELRDVARQEEEKAAEGNRVLGEEQDDGEQCGKGSKKPG